MQPGKEDRFTVLVDQPTGSSRDEEPRDDYDDANYKADARSV
jgi:hypothetical protein